MTRCWRTAWVTLAIALVGCGYYSPPIRPDASGRADAPPDAVVTPDDATNPADDAEPEDSDG